MGFAWLNPSYEEGVGTALAPLPTLRLLGTTPFAKATVCSQGGHGALCPSSPCARFIYVSSKLKPFSCPGFSPIVAHIIALTPAYGFGPARTLIFHIGSIFAATDAFQFVDGQVTHVQLPLVFSSLVRVATFPVRLLRRLHVRVRRQSSSVIGVTIFVFCFSFGLFVSSPIAATTQYTLWMRSLHFQ